jgi:hypothetical protein
MDGNSVEALTAAIAELQLRRQSLRRIGAERRELEHNRLEIARAQQELSAALIARYRPAA